MAALPRLSHGWLDKWLYDHLNDYAKECPEIINFVYNRSGVFVPGRPGVTCPEPDIAAYRDFPLDQLEGLDWDAVSPLLVAEILSRDTADKDLVRNVALYLEVPSIREYWLFDLRETAAHPLTVYRRQTKKWKRLPMAFGETYATRLLPGFELVLESLE